MFREEFSTAISAVPSENKINCFPETQKPFLLMKQ
jgi:hypothetical protein